MSKSFKPLSPLPQNPREALEPYDPGQGHGPWDARTVAHLLRRAVGGPRPGQVRKWSQRPVQALLQALFEKRDPHRENLWQKLGRSSANDTRNQLAAWWLLKLVQEDRAPGTRLSLFWHDHFACAQSKVRNLRFLFEQHQSFLEFGEGSFLQLLIRMSQDPAMLRFLDGDSNRRGVPNENLAREILELFALGEGNYTEQDIQEAARSLTGQTVRRGTYQFVAAHHDPDPKLVLGQQIQNGEDLCKVLVSNPQCAEFLTRKLWMYYVSPNPSAEVVQTLAEKWRQQDLQTHWIVHRLLSSRAFFSAEAYRCLVKSPVDYVVGMTRALGAKPNFIKLAQSCESMGQALFEPPGVQGWQDGDAWIHAATWIERTNFAGRVAGGAENFFGKTSPTELFSSNDREDSSLLLDRLVEIFLNSDLEESRRQAVLKQLPAASESLLEFAAHTVLCLPEYHLG